MSEKEIEMLKKQLKQEILAEIRNKKESDNKWKLLKEELEDEFKKLNYVEHFKFPDGREHNTDRNIVYILQNAIGTILKVAYKVDNVSKIDAEYEDMKDMVENIFRLINENRAKYETDKGIEVA